MTHSGNRTGLRLAFLMAMVVLMLSGVARAQSTVKAPLADGFDFPVGKPNGAGY
ncbi:MAG: hypothetical protein QM755_12980 [Luteolibacter sp.]